MAASATGGIGMIVWRTWASLLLMLLLAGSSLGQSYKLAEAPVAGKYFHVQVEMKLAGEMVIRQESKRVPLREEARASHDFRERVLEVGANDLPSKCARLFKTARATV